MRPHAIQTALFQRLLAFLLLLAASAAFAAAGDTDLIVKAHIPGAMNKANRVIVQPDGKYLTAGVARFGTLQFSVTRYNADGTIDTTFGDRGTLFEPLGSGDSTATDVSVQADGKVVVGGFVTDGGRDHFAVARFDASGILDTSFGGGGAATAIGSGNARANALVLQADGKVLLAGYATNGSQQGFAIARYTTGATLDGTFGSGGVVITPIGGGSAEAASIALQSDGKIVVAGSLWGGGAAVARYNADGSLDAGFNGSGIATLAGFSSAASVALQSDGKIVVGGTDASNATFAVARLNADGTVDTGFGSGGTTVVTAYTNGANLKDVVVQSDGKIVAGGNAADNSRNRVAIVRLTSTGALDTSFGSGTGVVFAATTSEDEVQSLAVTGDGRYVVAGATFPSVAVDPFDEMIARFTSSGALDTTFNGTGFRTVDLGSAPAAAKGTVLQPDGKIVVAGYVNYEDNLTHRMVVARYNADGTLDTAFGTDGLAITGYRANAVALQGSKIIAAGFEDVSGQKLVQVARFNADGTLDATFGTSGFVNLSVSGIDDEATSVAVQSDGKIVVGGLSNTGTFTDSLVVRLGVDGALDASFNGSGKALVAASTGNDQVNGLALQLDGKIVAVGTAQVTGGNDAFEVLRLNADGTPDSGFGTAGVVTTPIGSFLSQAYGVAVQSDGRILAGGLMFNGSTDDFAVARYNTDGSLDSGFGSGGIAVNDFGNHNRIFALRLLSDGKVAVAGEWAGAFTAGLYNANGTIDTSFGSSGAIFQQVNFNAGADHAWSLAIQPDGKWVLAGDGSGLFAWTRIFGEGGGTAKVNPTVSLSSSLNPSNSGDSVTFTASVSGTAGGATGTVSFLDGGTAIPSCSSIALSGGSASCTTSGLSGGSHSITAQYSGDASYNAGTSNTVTQAVNATSGKSTPSVSLASSRNPATSGERVTFTAAVTGGAGTATGTVDFHDGGASIPGCGAVALSAGSASCAYANLAAGNRTITAHYSGNASYNAAASSAITQVIANASFGAPTPVSPTGTISTTTPTYTWNAVGSATSYQLLVQNTQGVAVNVTVSASAAGCGAGTGTCSTTPSTALTAGAAYSWFVKAFNGSTASDWGGPMGISVSSGAGGGGGGGGFGTPSLVSPSGTVNTKTPTYTWNAVGTATSYQLLVQNTQGVAVNVNVSASAAGCGAGTGTCSFTPSTALTAGASYSWFVKAFSSSAASDWGGPMGISVSSSASGGGGGGFGTPSLVSPSGTVTTTTPTYTWNAVGTATSYQVLVQNTQGVAVNVTVGAADAGCGAGTGTCSITPSTALTAGASYSWFVKAFSSSAASDWGGPMGISVSSSASGGGGSSGVPAAPTLVSPSGTTATTTPTYTWNASAGATTYQLLVQNTQGVAVNVTVDATTAGCGAGTGTCSITPSTALSAHTAYSWFVKAANSQGVSDWSSGLSIRTP